MPLPTTTILDDTYNEIVTVLQSIVDPNATSTKLFQNTDSTWNIYDGAKTEFTGTPAAVIIPADGPASKLYSNIENYRGYGFYIFVAMDTTPTNYSLTRKNMRLIVDAVLDALDRSDYLNANLDVVQAASLKWIEEETSTGVNIVAPLQITGQKTVQIQ
jgi:hypothetical protein